MLNPTTGSATVCQKHNSLYLGHNVEHLVPSRIVQKHLNMRRVQYAEIAVVILIFVVLCVLGYI